MIELPIYAPRRTGNGELDRVQDDLSAILKAWKQEIDEHPIAGANLVESPPIVMGQILKVVHGLSRPFSGFIPGDGVKLRLAPVQSSPNRTIDLLVDPWYPLPTVSLNGNAQTLAMSGLDGNVDLAYRLDIHFVEGSGGGSVLDIRPQSVAPTNKEVQQLFANAATPGASSSDGLYIKHTTNGDLGRFFVDIDAIDAGRRQFHSRGTFGDGTAGGQQYVHIGSQAYGDSGNITSLQLNSSVANGLGAGTYIRADAYAPRQATAKVWVY